MFDQTPNQNPAMPMGGYNYNGYQLKPGRNQDINGSDFSVFIGINRT